MLRYHSLPYVEHAVAALAKQIEQGCVPKVGINPIQHRRGCSTCNSVLGQYFVQSTIWISEWIDGHEQFLYIDQDIGH